MNRRLIIPLFLLLVSAAFRFHPLAADLRFQPDEALFSTFARHAALNGAWLLPGALDKPPLSIYASALSMTLFIDAERLPGLLDLSPRLGEFAARLPNALASLIVVALTYALARRLYRKEHTARLAMLLAALSPYAVGASATAYTDGLMLLGMVAALWAVSTRRLSAAGICLAFGFAAKQQALFYLPLLVGLAWALTDDVSLWRLALRLLVPTLVMAGILMVWDAARGQATGFWALASAYNDPWRLVRSSEVIPRLQAWLEDGGFLLGAPVITAALAAISLGAIAHRRYRQPRRRAVLIDLILLSFTLGYGLLHWLVAFNTYPRYLLPLVPVLALLAGRGVEWATKRFGRYSPAANTVVLWLLGLLMLFPAWDAANGRLKLIGDYANYEGVDALAAYLNRRAPGAIIYDHWLGWELDYYLGQWTDKRRVYYPTPRALADDALRQPDPAPRYFVAPAHQALTRWLDALATAGFRVTENYRSDNFVVVELAPPWAARDGLP